MAGWWRTGSIFIISGVGGMAVTAIFQPYQISTGATCAIFGMLGALLVELFQSWSVSATFALLQLAPTRLCV